MEELPLVDTPIVEFELVHAKVVPTTLELNVIELVVWLLQ
jgi:hypothetical protein